MGDKTGIAWTQATWNPFQGCTKVSPGCANCYMYTEKRKYGQDPEQVVRSKPPTFNRPLSWKEPRMVFTCSWSDFFHEVADPWRDEAWDIIRRTPHLTYQVLTKRPERILEHLPADWGEGWANVWLGTSVENQRWANTRIPLLVNVPATVRFLSCEPLLGPVDLATVRGYPLALYRLVQTVRDLVIPAGLSYSRLGERARIAREPGVHWVIVGGESGPGYREMDLDWARTLRDECLQAGVAFFYKQGSGPRSGMAAHLDGQVWHQFPGNLADPLPVEGSVA